MVSEELKAAYRDGVVDDHTRQAIDRLRAYADNRGFQLAADTKLVTDYLVEMVEVVAPLHERQARKWASIAAAMGYEPNAHKPDAPFLPWLVERIAKYRLAAAHETLALTPPQANDEAVEAVADDIASEDQARHILNLRAMRECCTIGGEYYHALTAAIEAMQLQSGGVK